MRKLKFVLYAIVMSYMALALLFLLMADNPYAKWGIDLRQQFDLGLREIVEILALGNLIGVCLFVLLWSTENLHLWQLKYRNNKKDRLIIELKAKLYDKQEETQAKLSEAPASSLPTHKTEIESATKQQAEDRHVDNLHEETPTELTKDPVEVYTAHKV